MRELALTEWLSSQETKALLSYLRRRTKTVTAAFLAGAPVDQVSQGRAAAFNEICALLELPSQLAFQKLRDTVQNTETP